MDQVWILEDPKPNQFQIGIKSRSVAYFNNNNNNNWNPSQHASLMKDLRSFDDSYLLTESDPETAWNAFYSTIWDWLDRYYPLQQISVTSREPPFMTPDTKFLLRKKNRLMRQGRTDGGSIGLVAVNCEGWIIQLAQRNFGNASTILLIPEKNLNTGLTLVPRN